MTAYSQDTTRLYCLPIWKAWRIARDLSTLDRQTILLDSAYKVIDLKNNALNKAELTIQASDSAYLAKENEARLAGQLIENERLIHKEEKKGIKKVIFILGSGLTFETLLLLLILL